jgi:hypothetical protein
MMQPHPANSRQTTDDCVCQRKAQNCARIMQHNSWQPTDSTPTWSMYTFQMSVRLG